MFDVAHVCVVDEQMQMLPEADCTDYCDIDE